MFEKLKALKERFDELDKLIADNNIIANQEEWQKLVKERAALEEVMETYKIYLEAEENYNSCKEMLEVETDVDMRNMVKEEMEESHKKMQELTETMKIQLLPKDPDDDKNVIIEIRGGAGGDEAALFGADLMRMYLRYAERHRWKVKEIDSNITEIGGVKEATFMLTGKDAYSKLKFESGVHRVQRIPETESQGRVHTSTATVAVLPEVKDVNIEINDKDIRVDTYRSSGAGGQHVNKTSSAIRITHFPTGIVVQCQNERSQIQNRETAMEMLKNKLYDYYKSQEDEKHSSQRKNQIGSGDRSERIRTYNFPQGRVTDHRIGMTLYNLEAFLDGDMEEMIEGLQIANQEALLKLNEN